MYKYPYTDDPEPKPRPEDAEDRFIRRSTKVFNRIILFAGIIFLILLICGIALRFF